MAKVLIIASLAESLLNFRGPLIKAIQDAGHQVYACAPDCDSAFKARLAQASVTFFPVPMSRAGLNPLEDLATLRAIKQVCSTIHPDCVLAYTIKPVVYGLLAARLAGVRRRFALITGLGYAFTIKNAGIGRRFVNKIAQYLYLLGLQGAEVIFFQNPDDQALFAQLGLLPEHSQVSVINGSGVDTEYYALAELPEKTTFLLIARLLADKGIREYVAAAEMVKQKYPHIMFNLAGPLDPNPSAISETELNGWIDSGVINYSGSLVDVRPSIDAASIYVLPSYREGTPRSVLEAMSKGRPVITTDAPGCRETVVNGVNGYLVPVNDASALASAMIKLIESPELVKSMAASSRNIAVEKYDVHKVNKIMLTEMGLCR